MYGTLTMIPLPLPYWKEGASLKCWKSAIWLKKMRSGANPYWINMIRNPAKLNFYLFNACLRAQVKLQPLT
jgi:hypothetical protein